MTSCGPNRKATNSVTLEIHVSQRSGAVRAQSRVIAALDNPEQCVTLTRHDFEGSLAALGPAQ